LLMLRFTRGNVEPGGHYCSRVIRRLRSSPVGTASHVLHRHSLAVIDERPHPAAVADALRMPKPTVTVYLKRLVAAQLVRREIDADDLRRHRLNLTPAGRRVMVRGLVMSLEISKKALYYRKYFGLIYRRDVRCQSSNSQRST
jgi:DNA-binding MarR family transcriptional regulator